MKMNNIDKMLKNMIGKKKVGASIPLQKVWGNMNMNQKMFSRKFLRDTDKDGVPNLFDCQMFNRRFQDAKPNIMMRERIEKLPVYLGTHQQAHISEKNVGPKLKQARTEFYKAVKYAPHLLSDIEELKGGIIFAGSGPIKGKEELNSNAKKDIVTSGRHLQLDNDESAVIIYPEKESFHTTSTLFHELKHSKQPKVKFGGEQSKNAINYYKKHGNPMPWAQRPRETEAVEYEYQKLSELRGEKAGEVLRQRGPEYTLSLNEKERDEIFDKYEKEKKIALEEDKQLEEQKKTEAMNMFVEEQEESEDIEEQDDENE